MNDGKRYWLRLHGFSTALWRGRRRLWTDYSRWKQVTEDSFDYWFLRGKYRGIRRIDT